jgi:acyl carrier protein
MEDKLKKLLSVLLGVDQEKINNDTSNKTINEWDSLKQMNIIVAIEEEFDIQFSEEESILSDSYVALLQLIQKKIKD